MTILRIQASFFQEHFMKSGFTTVRKTGLYITHRPVRADEILRMAQRLIQRLIEPGKRGKA
jgi:hypothetical protein